MSENYLIKHWRGEHSFLRVCLLNGVLLGLFLYYIPARFLFIAEIFPGIIFAGLGMENADIKYFLRILIFLALIACWIIPSVFWMVWFPVGGFRYSIKKIQTDKTLVGKVTACSVLSVVVIISFIAFKYYPPAFRSMWDAGSLNPQLVFTTKDLYFPSAEERERVRATEMLGGDSFSEAPVEFSIAGVTYRIPRNYLVVMRDWRGGAQSSVDIRVNLPDLEPLTQHTKECFLNHPYGISSNSSLNDVSSKAGCVPFQVSIAAPGLTTAEEAFQNFRNLFNDQHPLKGPAGLDKYESGGGDHHVGEYYYKSDPHHVIFYECSLYGELAGKRLGSCRPMADRTTTGAELNYFFDVDMIEKMPEMDEKIRKLIEGFAVTAPK